LPAAEAFDPNSPGTINASPPMAAVAAQAQYLFIEIPSFPFFSCGGNFT
jgi:hypothetical protein